MNRSFAVCRARELYRRALRRGVVELAARLGIEPERLPSRPASLPELVYLGILHGAFTASAEQTRTASEAFGEGYVEGLADGRDRALVAASEALEDLRLAGGIGPGERAILDAIGEGRPFPRLVDDGPGDGDGGAAA